MRCDHENKTRRKYFIRIDRIKETLATVTSLILAAKWAQFKSSYVEKFDKEFAVRQPQEMDYDDAFMQKESIYIEFPLLLIVISFVVICALAIQWRELD